MKKVFLILLFVPIFSTAQNWHSVPVGQHNIYRVSVTGPDSMWDGYVRNIYIDSVINNTNGTQFNFYKSQRRNELEIIDTANGPSWLGRSVFRESNGDEYFLNKYLDTVRIKTRANLNESWIVTFDTAGIKHYEATVIGLDTMTIDGVLDSIKKIDVQAYIGSNATASIYNTYQIVLSKANGFYQTIDFYGFPEYENASIETSQWDSASEAYPILPYIHTRLDSSLINRNYNSLDLSWRYQAGNEILIETGRQGFQAEDYTYDSIISVMTLHPDTFIVNSKRVEITYNPPTMGNPPVQVFTSNIIVDTVYRDNGNKKLKDKIFEDRVFGLLQGFYAWHWTFIDSFCQDKIIVRDTFGGLSPLSGSQREQDWYYEGAGIFLKDFFSTNGAVINHIAPRLIYYNFNGCKYGTYFPLWPQNTNNLSNKNNLFKIYPNPISGILHIDSEHEWQKVEIISLQGKIVKSFLYKERKAMDIASLTNGLYILKVSTPSGNFIYKILKE